MIKCLAIDDEPLALQQMAGYIKKIPFLELVGKCYNALEAWTQINNGMIDAIFCDINMPDLNGMDFVKSLADPPIIVFTTAYSEYAIEGYKVDAVDYLLKPFAFPDFQRAANKVKARYDQKNAAILSNVDTDDSIFLKTESRVVHLRINDIRLVEGMSEYLKIHVDGRTKPIIVLLSMKKMEERLPQNMFMRVHRSYIVNLKKIQEVNKKNIILGENEYIPIGDNYKEQFNDYLNSKFLSK